MLQFVLYHASIQIADKYGRWERCKDCETASRLREGDMSWMVPWRLLATSCALGPGLPRRSGTNESITASARPFLPGRVSRHCERSEAISRNATGAELRRQVRSQVKLGNEGSSATTPRLPRRSPARRQAPDASLGAGPRRFAGGRLVRKGTMGHRSCLSIFSWTPSMSGSSRRARFHSSRARSTLPSRR